MNVLLLLKITQKLTKNIDVLNIKIYMLVFSQFKKI